MLELVFLTLVDKTAVVCDGELRFSENAVWGHVPADPTRPGAWQRVADLGDMSVEAAGGRSFRVLRLDADLAAAERFELGSLDQILFRLTRLEADNTRLRLHRDRDDVLDLPWDDEARGWRLPDGRTLGALHLRRAALITPHPRHRLSPLAEA